MEEIKYNVIKPRFLGEGHYDQCDRLFHGCMEMLCCYVEETQELWGEDEPWHERYATTDGVPEFMAKHYPDKYKQDKEVKAVYNWYIKHGNTDVLDFYGGKVSGEQGYIREEAFEQKRQWAMDVVCRCWRSFWV